ncbi:MAG: hypothetical protein A3D74_00180 [Candidatus Levybacteria bacterium RIFCSPHIGHO2_02_FULL_37_13]|nr:MAG: hypothetical protein A3D74_00180 [Candidatus Levybacteria bacterium RIFCSPHIGHO2_02_FULL_37_13]OGH29730.1 MAG: hypothetical protein A3E40_02885 [Candidatus Levybacteria bacterium RIFCSPHIGHO2_12_FULL_37_9]OGH39399.1 MAG: hypothetical protein A3B41_01365 [Candidatus Levybacteria bacterium RIFCSPLOWO2_01_FULL_37_26]
MKTSNFKFQIIIFILLIILAFRFFLFYRNQPQYQDGQRVSFKTTLLKEPQNFGRYQRFTANINPSQEVFITVPAFSQLHYGDTLNITGTLKERVIGKNKTIITMSYPKIEKIEGNKNFLLSISSFIRQKATLLFEKSLPPTSASLLLGIVFGIKETMPKDFTESLRISGVFHVVAASGMNVTLVGGFLSSVFGFFLKRQIAIIASIAGIGLYAVMAGLDPPIVRASIMGIVVFTAQLIGRQTLGAYGLFLSGFVMLFFSPNLIFDIGFQLSFLATFGLLFIRPVLEHRGKVKKFIEKSIIGEGVVTTIAAQTATLPILVGNFGTYSLWSIVVNGLVLWTIPALMIIGSVAVLFGMILPESGQLISYAALPFLLYFEKIIMFFGKIGGVVALEDIPWQFIVGYYCILLAFIFALKRRSKA